VSDEERRRAKREVEQEPDNVEARRRLADIDARAGITPYPVVVPPGVTIRGCGLLEFRDRRGMLIQAFINPMVPGGPARAATWFNADLLFRSADLVAIERGGRLEIERTSPRVGPS
jgi:hypothetical protein